jgi:hypothetical protein
VGRRALVICVLALAVVPAAAAVPHLVTPTTIGGLRLAVGATTYERALGEQPLQVMLPAGETKLVFAKAALTVTLDARGRGIAIETNAAGYSTRGGAHPCGSLHGLAREFRSKLRAIRAPSSQTIIAYRAAGLTFSVSAGKIGSIMLSTPGVPPSVAVNSAQCTVEKAPA